MNRKPENLESVYRLSPTQEGILYHTLVGAGEERGEAPYFQQMACALRGDLRPALFRRAWEGAVARHPALRTAFHWQGLENPVQVVNRTVALPWEELDWSGLDAAEQERRWEDLRRSDRARGLDLSQAPPLRLTLVRLGEALHRCLWSFHHISVDGWCLPLIFEEVFALYAGQVQGQAPRLAPVRPYRDYIAWLQRRNPAADEAYWRDTLAGFHAPTPLGLEGGSGSGRSERRTELSAAETAAVAALARRCQVTASTVVQAAWALLLGWYSGEDDVVFGAVFSGRSAPVPGIESMIGLFINTLPVRVRMPAAGTPAAAWLRQLQERHGHALQHEATPLIRVQGWSEVPRGTPLFETLLAFENYPVQRAASEGGARGTGLAGVEILHSTDGGSHYPLALAAFDGERLELRAGYERSQVAAAAAERVLGHVRRLLLDMAAGADRPVAELSPLSGEERRQVLRAWSGAEVRLEEDTFATLHGGFEAQAARTPDAVAATLGDTAWTYGQLNSRANQIAHRLIRAGVRPETPVGIALERSPEALAALLGVLKAGGAYLPLDPAQPAERLRRLLERSGAALLPDTADLAAEPAGNPGIAVPPAGAAYLLFTSGSTGEPKGVLVPHRAALHLLTHARRTFGIDGGCRVAQMAALTFDASVLEIFSALHSGARVCLVPREALLSGEALADQWVGQGVTHAFAVPAHLVALPPGEYPALRNLVTGADRCTPEMVERWAPGRRFHNVYGPTEAVIYSTIFSWRSGIGVRPLGPPIGRPIAGSEVYLLDRHGRPVAAGLEGEILLGGAGLARGYLDRPDLTAERFVPHPFAQRPGERLYRTGDLARWLPDGELELLGRTDHQVKLRGFRIEPGEIEAALAAHPCVAEAAVAAQGEGGDRWLVAFVAPRGDESLDMAELRGFCQERLPAYMVPAAFVELPTLPRSATGKVDRRALPFLRPSQAVARPAGTGTAARTLPRTPTEELMLGIWEALLGTSGLGVEDDFFVLGGHSLLVVRLLSRIRDAWNVEVPVRALFERSTLAGLAALVDERLRGGAAPERPPVEPVSREGALPLSFAQQRLWVLDRLEPGLPAYNMPFAVRLQGRLDAPALENSLRGLVARHEVLRTRYAEEGGEPVQIVAPVRDVAAAIVLPRIDLSALPGEAAREESERLAKEESLRRFDLRQAPLLRALLLQGAAEDHALLLTLHHIASDGWSMGILARDLTALYAGSPLPELPIQYGDFAVWQRRWLRGGVLDGQLAWWRERLSGAEPLDLRGDRPRPAVASFRGGRAPLRVDGALLARLEALARSEGATLFMVVLAAFQALLHRYTGQEDLIVGTPSANRDQSEIEELIGFFVNLLPLRTALAGGLPFPALLARARETALGAYAHRDLPFERLVEEIAPERDLSRSPIFQAVVQVFPAAALPQATLAGSGLALAPLGYHAGTARFDLSLTLTATGDGLEGGLDYALDLFDGTSGRLMADHLQALLTAIAADPKRPLLDLPLLVESETRHVLAAAPLPALREPVAETFRRWSEQQPDCMALDMALEPGFSYAWLAARAGAVALALRSAGVEIEAPVAVLLDREPDLVASLLGILGAGAAFLPLDPGTPRAQLAYLLADSGARVLIAARRHLPLLPEGGPPRLLLDDLAPAAAPFEPLPVPPEALAYMIYTSGSTGRPKGVQVTQASLANYLAWVNAALPAAVLPATARPSFDAALKQLLAPLVRGGSVWLVPGESLDDPAALLRLLATRPGAGLNVVPSLWRALLETLEANPALLPEGGLAALLLGGEPLDRDLVDRTLDALPGAELWNLYGPTETTANATAGRLHRGGRVTLGEPAAGSRVVLLDRALRPVPPGIPGEIGAGGPGVARGYAGRPDLTAERFVPDPFGEPGARLYRTGDLARRLPGGGLEFLGRLDDQIKVRGFRIEPGEVEAALALHPAIREAAVGVRPAAGEPLLVAWFVPRDGAAPAAADLRRFLRDRLPDYLIPVAFLAVEALPRTAGRKLDRAALPDPLAGSVPAAGLEAPPRAPLEELLAGIWQDLLGTAPGPDDDFFAAGGHSLLAVRLVSRVREALGVEMPLRSLFERPTLGGLAGTVEDLLRGGQTPLAPPVRPVRRDGPLPLSFPQQRLWVLDRINPDLATYNLPLRVRLKGELDESALERALAEILRRHEVLRTRFEAPAGEPAQVIEPAAGFRLPVVDLRGLPEEAGEARRLAAEEAGRAFDLGRAPLLRSALLRRAPGPEADWVLLLTLHHIAADGWSLEILVRELVALYGAFAAGRPSPLPELEVQYADYAVWQRGRLAGEVLETQLAWWRERLAGAATLDLPADRPRPPVQSFRGGQVPLRLGADTAAALRALGKERGATAFMGVLAAFQALLHRVTGQEDVVVGVPSANRDRREIEGLIGFFVNMLPLRARVEGALPFADLLARVREVSLGAYAHRDLPFERLVEEVQPERNLSRNPVFQAAAQVMRAAEPVLVGGLSLLPLDLPVETARFDLNLALTESGERLEGTLEYASDLFDRATAVRLASQLSRLLRAALASPGRRVDELPLLDSAERHQLLAEWNDAATDYPAGRSVPELFAEVAAQTPEAPAVVFGGEALTYAELDRRSAAVARRLFAAGARRGSRVGVFLERSPDLIAVLLGILRCGAAYLPLDPSYPAERLALMLEDAEAPVLVTREELRDRLPAGRAEAVVLDGLEDGGEAFEAPEVSPDDLAYVLYTSGSTGRPKGVAVPHRAIVRLVRDTDYARLGPDDRVAQASNASFDAATWEIWGALLNGGCLVGIARDTAIEPRELAAELRERGITALFLTTALFNQITREVPGAFAGLRHLLFGGEAVDPAWVRAVLRAGGPQRLLHVYGPTESTTFTTWHPVAAVPEGARTVPIGRPIANTRVDLLGPDLRPVPAGVAGELCAGGDGLAWGYWNRPDLTAERFVPDPHGAPGARLYRTGDRARRRHDGAVEFLGRDDQQVKVRGFRIEPGEIEAALREHPGVRDACVVAREDGGDRRLVAYLEPGAGPAPSPAALREALRGRLPDYMVPAAFVTLDALPLTPNRKIDRAALPAPALADAVSAGEDGAPRTPTEELLVGIWEELFAARGIGVGDDFFLLGGHSLLAVQLVSRVRETFAVEIPLRALFERPTIEGLAEEVERALRAGGGLEMPPIVPVDRWEPLPLSFAQQRLWILDQMEIDLAAYNVPLAARFEGDLHAEALRRSLERIVHRHETLRTGFEWMDGNPVQAIFPPEELDLPRVDLSVLSGPRREAEAVRLSRAEAARPFDLEIDRLFRTALLKLGEREHVLLFTLHHIISDGWSVGVLLRELSELYAAFRAGRPADLPELPVQYADYAVWQRQWMQGEPLERQLAWWRKALAGAPVLELPTDRPRRTVRTFRGGVRSVVLERELGEAVAALCRSEKVTPFMAFLAAWQILLHRYTGERGERKVVVGTPVANRNRVEIERLVGFFVNTLVLGTDLAGSLSGREALRRVREVTLGAFAHQDMPFQKLVEELQPQRAAQRSPFFEVFFVLQNAPMPAVELPGLRLSALPVETGAAKFEMTLGLAEGADGWIASAEYNRDLFDASTAGRLLEHFRNVLVGLAGAPDGVLRDLELMTGPERHQLVAEWNDTRWGDPAGAAIHRLFEERAAAAPDAPALVSTGGEIRYGELNRRANRLARRLRGLGVGPETPVGVFLDSSPDLILAYLAILKAGGAYVPLGTAYPEERLAFLIRETGAPVVLTHAGLVDRLPEGTPTLALDLLPPLGAEDSGEEDGNLAVETGGRGLAYIIYTSGSTGRPKGVAVTHEGVVRLVRDSGFVRFGPDEVILQITATTFDVSTFEIWGALLHGGRLAFPPSAAPTLEELGAALARFGVTTLWLTSGLFGLMADRRLEDLRPLRQLLAGGDVVPVAQARRVLEELPGTRLINGYGPTENSVFTACHTVRPQDAERPSIPIGRPLGNSQAYVLDEELRPVPAGVPGELFGGGLGVARGYFGRPDLTAERFLPDPFAAEPGARLYRTGDLARWLADGAIEFLGRRDTQVKIRGFRIEPGEVEAVLAEHPQVAEAAVVAREDRPGQRRLIAYVVGDAPAAADLQAFLRRSLPDYMVPSAFVLLEHLPLTANGKIDRAALPAPEDVARESQATFVPPRTPLEESIAAVWREVLGVERVGVHDNFFDLGGHSLLLLQAVSRLSELLGRELPKGKMFEHPTIAALARELEPRTATAEEEERSEPSLEQSQDRAAARRESIRQRRRPVRGAAVAEQDQEEEMEVDE